jgi:Proteasome subunit/Proteasome subunit A N-terminal signature
MRDSEGLAEPGLRRHCQAFCYCHNIPLANADMYDTDVTTFSPQGRLFQVEYAMEAVKQGSACVGATSKKFAVIAALKRSPGELASYQQKVYRLDEHMGLAMSGLTADGRSLVRYMRGECLNHKFVYGSPLQAERLISDVADKHQRATWSYVRRPYGVGLLVAAYDVSFNHTGIFHLPDANRASILSSVPLPLVPTANWPPSLPDCPRRQLF